MKNNKIVKVVLILTGLAAISYGGFRAYEYFSGVVRLKYSKITKQTFSEPPITEPLPE
jgi:hypothetical protein